MWAEFWLAFALVAALVVVPGALALRALGARPAVAVALAPALSICAYALCALALRALGVRASTPVVVAPLVVVAVVLLVWRRRRRRIRAPRLAPARRAELACLGLYLACGLAATCLMYVANLSGPDSFIEAWDNVAHLSWVRSMSVTGDWSVFGTTYYPPASADLNPLPTASGYYPNAWHLLAVMLVDALGVSVTVAANVVNVLACAVVFPAGAWMLLVRVFPRRPVVVALGALVCLAFSPYPWNLVPRWSLYPILLSMALLPAAIASFMWLAAPAATRRERVLGAAGFVLSCLAFLFAQPSSAFSAAVFLAPWLAWRLRAWRRARGDGRARATLWAAAFVVLCAGVWMVLLALPPLREVASYYWPPITDVSGAVDYALNLSFCDTYGRPVLKALVVVGLVCACARRGLRWVIVPALLSGAAFVVAAAAPDVPLKHIVAGFWYTDPYRVAAMTAIFLVPVAALGLATLAGALGWVLRARPRLARVVPGVAAGVCTVALFLPAVCQRAGLPAPWTDDFTMIAREMAEKNDGSRRAGYSDEKRAFVERVLEVVGPDERVLNLPFDGSVCAWPVSGLNTVYRVLTGYAGRSESGGVDGLSDIRETEWSCALREGLVQDGDAPGPGVADALRELDVEYLLVLDRDVEAMEQAYRSFLPWAWGGFYATSDETPGLEVVLAQGDMRLYHIDLDAWGA